MKGIDKIGMRMFYSGVSSEDYKSSDADAERSLWAWLTAIPLSVTHKMRVMILTIPIAFEILRDTFVLKITTKYAQSVITWAVINGKVTYTK